MRPIKSLALMTVVVVSSSWVLATPQATAPDVIESTVSGYVGPPIWVSARAAADGQTILKWDLFGDDPLLRQVVERQRQKLEGNSGRQKTSATDATVHLLPQDNCEAPILQSDHLTDEHPAQSLQDLLRDSKNIFKGTVLGVEPGFYRGAPASLLKVRVDDWIRSSNDYGSRTDLYVYHSATHFRIGPYEFCGYSPDVEPKVKDRVLIFDSAGPMMADSVLLTPRDEKVFAETPARRLALPKQIRQDPLLSRASSLDEIIEIVRHAGSNPKSISN